MKRFPNNISFVIFSGIVTAIAATLLSTGCSQSSLTESKELDSLYKQLDSALAESNMYQEEKERRLDRLRENLYGCPDDDKSLHYAELLIDEFESYQSDSTLFYINMAAGLARRGGKRHKEQELQLRRIDVMSHAGLFDDAAKEMASVDRKALPPDLLELYYYTNCNLYQYLLEYTNRTPYSENYAHLREMYIDSISAIAPEGSFNRVTYCSSALISEKKFDDAVKLLATQLSRYKSEERNYSILASILAYAYKEAGDSHYYKKYLVLSAISDVKGCTKENMSFRELSSELFNDGDIDRAKFYLRKSFDDANFYSARMRTDQSARMFTVIDKAYDTNQKLQSTRLKWLLLFSAVLSVALVVAIVLILRQMKRIRRANGIIRRHNGELSAISDKLRLLNQKLEETNAELKNSDSIKEEYAGLFMVYTSLAIRNLEHYRQTLSNLAMKGKMNELLKKIESSDIVEKTVKDFYDRFDEAVLNIYPSFVEKVNALMCPDARIVPRQGCRLNTELRILALIRIGISDSERIAEFLRCSLTTVYTYRSKIRKRSLCPDTFEADIKAINS